SDAGPAGAANLARVYFNLHPEHAVAVTRGILSRLLPLAIPYTYKIVSDPAGYRRRDTAVLYVARADLAAVMPQVLAAHDEQPAAFRPCVPSFTRCIRDGIAIADDPPAVSGVEVSF